MKTGTEPVVGCGWGDGVQYSYQHNLPCGPNYRPNI